MARIYKAKYYPNGDVLGAKLGSNPSYAWRNIHSSLEVIRRGTRWNVGNGKLIHIWEDKWLPTPTTYRVCSPPRTFDDFPMVSSLIDEDTSRWKIDLVQALFLPFEANTILQIPLSYSLPDDKIVWIGNKRGVFLVKSAYYVAIPLVDKIERGESSNGDYKTLLWKKMWQLKIPSKVRIFSWRACINGLPTHVNLRNRGIGIDALYPLCGKAPKSTQHALIFCEKIWELWWHWQACPISLLVENHAFIDVAMQILEKGTSHDLELFFVTAWSIWYN